MPFTHYTFDGDIVEHSGNNRHALQYMTTPVYIDGGNGKKALDCNATGTSSGVKTPFNFDTTFQQWTIICKIYPTAQGNWYNIFDKKYSNGPGFTYYYNTARPNGGWGFDSTWSGHKESGGTGNITLNAWHTIAVKFNNNDGVVYAYCDGQLISQYSAGSYTSGLENQPLTIGNSVYSSSRYFHGRMQDFLIYNKALTNEEIILIMKQI